MTPKYQKIVMQNGTMVKARPSSNGPKNRLGTASASIGNRISDVQK
jgi:hypothetical protein